MGERCEICLDPKCNGAKNCNCDTCAVKENCHRTLRPTIKITSECGQSCRHCCFNCGPGKNLKIPEMKLETAQDINAFMRSNKIDYANIMGGEFTCHTDWKNIVHTLADGIEDIRMPTNSDWAADPALAAEVIEFMKAHPHIRLALSKDRWHTNQHVDAAIELLNEAKVFYVVANAEQTKSDTIVPLGRSMFDSCSFYATFNCYCYKPDSRYTFLIDEEGEIYKCVFGMWKYDWVQNYTEGGFRPRFKEFGDIFYSVFMPNCMSCSRACPSDSRVTLK